MKKKVTMGIATILATTSFVPTVWAETSEQVNVKSVLEENIDQPEKDENREELIYSLSLDEAIKYGLNSDFSLMKIKLSIDQLKSIIYGTLEDEGDLRDVIRQLESQLSEIQKQIRALEQMPEIPEDNEGEDGSDNADEGNDANDEGLEGPLYEKVNIEPIQDESGIENESDGENGNQDEDGSNNGENGSSEEDALAEKEKLKGELEKARNQIRNEINNLYDALDTVADTIIELESQREVQLLNQEQIEEMVKLSIISRYTSLNMINDQFEFMKQSIKSQQQQVHLAKRQYEVGLISLRDYETTKRDQRKLEAQIEQLEKQYAQDLATFALDIGVTYHPDLSLEKQDLGDLELIKQKLPTETIIKNSFQMKEAQEKLALARTKRDNVYEDGDAHSYAREQADIAVKLELLNIEELEVTLENAIKNLYYQIFQQYEAMLEAEDEITYAEEEVIDMKIRYEVGLISKAEYELATMTIEQAKFNYEMEKYNYYLLLKQEELLESGVIPSN